MGAAVSAGGIPVALTLAERGMRPIPTYPDEGVIEHYIPPSFPLEVYITPSHMDLCRRTWKLIVTGQANGMSASQGRSGIVLFYDEFYFRLFQRAKVFREIFPNMQKRGEVLTKAFGYMLKLKGDNGLGENMALARLGHDHQFKSAVRPWHFPAYCEVALEVLMFWLGTDATVETGEAWTMLITYVLQRVLGTFLIGKVDGDEFYQNKGGEVQDAMSPKKKQEEAGAGQKIIGGSSKGMAAADPSKGEKEWVPLHVRKEWAAKKAQAAAKDSKKDSGTAEKRESGGILKNKTTAAVAAGA